MLIKSLKQLLIKRSFDKLPNNHWKESNRHRPVLLLLPLIIFDKGKLLIEMHSNITEQVLVYVNNSVSTSTRYDLLGLLIQSNVLLEASRNLNDLLVGELCLVVPSDLG